MNSAMLSYGSGEEWQGCNGIPFIQRNLETPANCANDCSVRLPWMAVWIDRAAGILPAANSFSPWGGFSRQGYAGAGFLATATVGAATFGAINVAVSVIGAETNVLIAARQLISGVDVVVTGGLITGSGSCAADSLGSRYDAGYDSNSSTNLPPNRAQHIPGFPVCGTIRFSYGQDV